MKVGTLASLLSLVAIVASAAVPQTPLALGNISNDTRPSAPLRDTPPFGFVLPHRHEITQCARAELRWENGTALALVAIIPLAAGTDEAPPVCQLHIGWYVPSRPSLS
ncbi:hypothetical protein GSI_08609 [Ganoderma sinense ZZ0214-1]|uniref:Uncharacterized protein n=1 Tax=Ganoderma sinense ZZ0214-1 TaxID=1077348 RepID=A0A2G8S4S1_9APHY|nr:hypothetical protein GSI_08609 [Ganoderma sinense ZZ0214-1]